MDRTIAYVKQMATELLKNISYSVEHMGVTQWCILGVASVVLGFMMLRTQRF